MDNIVKNEFFSDCSVVSFCQACLSTDRLLLVVTEYVDIFYKICGDQMLPAESLICWECMALLKRVRIFTRKVNASQRILQLGLMNKLIPFPQSLSSLTTSKIDNDQITLTHEEKEIKPIKQELDYDELLESCDNFDYSATEYIKDEPDGKPESTKRDVVESNNDDVAESLHKTDDDSYRKSKEFNQRRNEKRKAKYRFVNTRLKKHRGYLIRTIPIEFHEAVSSLEEERSNTSFVKAEYKCMDCVEVFSDEEELVKHRKKSHDAGLGSFLCDICCARFSAPDVLLSHKSRHCVRRECKVCWHQCVSASGMARHVENHHRMVQCLACQLFFKNVRLFYSHYKALHSRFVCDVCGKRCKSRDIIEKHLRCHFGYECPFCKKRLKNSSSYNNHVECQHTDSIGEGAYCVPCDTRFKNDKLYKRHLQSSAAHARERDNTRYSGPRKSRKRVRAQLKRNNSGEVSIKRKYPCPDCSNVYSRRTYMNNHYRHVHSKQSKHYCEECDRHFLNRTRYLDHRRFKHEGVQRDKDKLCNICGRGFAANRTLVNHIRTHSGERPFGCDLCGAKFTQKHAMMSHVKFIHLKNKRKPAWHE